MVLDNPKVFTCVKCNEQFTNHQELRRHFGKFHPKLHECSQCGSMWKGKHWLKRHISQMHGEKSLRCTVPGCEMTMAYNRLKRHMLEYHTGDHMQSTSSLAHQRHRPDFNCPHCPKVYQSRESLRKHIHGSHKKPYIRKKTYPCTIDGCDKVFKAPCILDDHMNKHNGNFS